jgi:hypothetical protein
MEEVRFPVKLNDNYTCQGIDRDGDAVVFDDLLRLGDSVAAFSDGDDRWGPFGIVVRRPDGLWVEASS